MAVKGALSISTVGHFASLPADLRTHGGNHSAPKKFRTASIMCASPRRSALARPPALITPAQAARGPSTSRAVRTDFGSAQAQTARFGKMACDRKAVRRPAVETDVAETSTEVQAQNVAPLIDLSEESSRSAAEGAFERVDDVVMGGVSSSRLVAATQRACLVWAGQCRVEGGGFTGCRTRAFAQPADLSQWDGLALTAALESDGEPRRRTWKATIRTQNDRGEMVYQAAFTPPVAVPGETPAPVLLPWSSFRLVRGPTVVPGVPPLSAETCKEVYGLGLIMSRFGPAGPMDNFRAGTFALAVQGLGVFSAAAAAPPPPPLLPALSTSKSTANRGTRTVLTWLLAPVLAIVFSEAARRRRQARSLLRRRYSWGPLRTRLFGQRLKRGRMSVVQAAVEGAVQLAADALAAVLALPVKALFLAARMVAKLMRALRGQKPLPPMRPPKPASS